MKSAPLAFIGRFGRLPLVGVTVAVIFIGVASTGEPVSWKRFVIALSVALTFHVGVFVINDVIDIDIDRTDPRRARSPLVAGSITRKTAALIGITSAVLGAVILASSKSSLSSLILYGCALTGLIVYDLYGKRFILPPVTDMIQGVGWGSLVLTGAAITRHLAVGSWLLAFAVCIYMAILNGVSGALRDVVNDMAHDARTTPSLFIGQPLHGGDMGLPVPYVLYGVALQIVESIACVAGMVISTSEMGRGIAPYVLTSLVAEACCICLLGAGLHFYSPSRSMWIGGFAFSILSFWAILIIIWVRFGTLAFLIASVLLIGPWLGSSLIRSLLTGGADWRARDVYHSSTAD